MTVSAQGPSGAKAVASPSGVRNPLGSYSTALSIALVLPWVALLAAGFIFPVGKLLAGSLLHPGFTFDHYLRVVEEPLYLRILLRTLRISLLVTVAAFVLGYPVAYAMARMTRRWALFVTACVLVPLWTSLLVRSYAWIVLFQRRGVINNTLIEIGIIDQPLRLIYTETAVMVAMTHVLLPFMILPIYGAVRTIPLDLTRAASNLGAGRFRAFLYVTLPLSLPGVFAGALITFILALGFYVTPALVGGPGTLMMATLIGQQTTQLLNWPFAGALSAVLLVVTVALAVAFRRLLAMNRGFHDAW